MSGQLLWSAPIPAPAPTAASAVPPHPLAQLSPPRAQRVSISVSPHWDLPGRRLGTEGTERLFK